MKKLVLFILGMMAIIYLKAEDTTGNMIVATLLDHVTTVSQFASGETKIALLDSVVQVGSYKGKSVFDLQAGFTGNTKPQPDQVQGINYVISGFLKVSSLLGDSIKYPDQWVFLKSLEHGIAYSYDLRERHGYGSYQIGLAFGLKPIQ